ncbi:molybdopterin-dependent oxidoreductase [Halocynthiibacter sp. C4]|uniref:molybdopterin-dependent oxidoreductase n=1 Tax=Halocynthiibacter sp. C4 TaxID=2992758 RepID=UPI00237AD5CF|nr:molybdopterin-dependent oxidoreductase [Halocynthiibacter sp. C4]MDE0588861.1 molybdopterin-dependent oxidoreductase [Halocynthiibacter sp. C4]
MEEEKIVLTVSGRAQSTDQGENASFSITSLRALPSESFKTSTVWTEGILEFKGVSLSVVLDETGLSGSRLFATAANDYNVEISIPEPGSKYPIIAYELNGKPMSLREKGPLWIVFPYDHSKDYQLKTIYAESVWQLESLTFEE